MAAARAAQAVKKSLVNAADAAKFVRYVDASPSPYHATAAAVAELESAGFTRLSERDSWAIEAGGKYYVTRNQSTVVSTRGMSVDICG